MTDKIVFFVRLAIAISFIILGVVVWYYREYTKLSETQTIAFTVLLIAYGLFRVYRAIKRSDNIFIEK